MLNLFAALINLNHPDSYLNYSFLSISLANLILIVIMLIIFGLAVSLPFPGNKKHKDEIVNHSDGFKSSSEQLTPVVKNGLWTYKLRRIWLKFLPPEKMLPDSQPAYVSSWIYVFGVASLAALGMAIISGLCLAIGGVDWWHTSQIGHFVNSVHLWSVEAFMAFLVIHLWGKFWLASWRGKRALTWMTGVLAFLVSVMEAFTGYLSQQNFSSQWIATNGKDAFNAVGVGSFFNLMNFGQMILWHVVLIPLVLVVIVAIHIILVRIRGVSHPLPVKRPKTAQQKLLAQKADNQEWTGPNRRYDILKEGTIAFVIVFVLVIGLAFLLSSPDKPPVTVQEWASLAPKDFIATTASELDGTSNTATYGPPYNHGHHQVQKLGFSWQLLVGVREPINTAQTFVIQPLEKSSLDNPRLALALNEYNQASRQLQKIWSTNYASVVTKVKIINGQAVVPKINDGPVPTLINNEYILARSGAIDADLLSQHPFYGTNYTKPLLFIEDGNYFSSLAKKDHLYGTQWGVMNESGSYPGQPWLWLYTLWYQVPGFATSVNVDLIAVYLTTLASALLMFVPFIPGLRDIPRYIPIHKLIYRQYHKYHKN